MNSSGVLYEPHDIGNVLLMCPAALLVNYVSGGAFEAKLASPPIIGRVAVSFTYALFSALGCFFFYRMATLYHSEKISFLLSLGFLVTTFFWAYTKTAFDVLGACVGTCITLYFAAKILREEDGGSPGDVASLALALIVVGSFRITVLPFFATAALICLYFTKQRLSWRQVATGLLVFGAGILPTLFYNYIRMGSVLVPATTAKQFAATGSLTGSEFPGLYGLLVSPNRGLIEFNPILVVLFALPLVWRQVGSSVRVITGAFGGMSLLYIAGIAKVPAWSSVSWGPRYLLPTIPVFCFAAVPCVIYLWKTHRNYLLAVTAVSAIISAAPVLVNWHLASSENSRAQLAFAYLPYQQMAIWKGLVLGLEGKPLPAPADVAVDPVRSGGARFPDLWTFRLMESSRKGLIAGWITISFLILAIFWSGRIILVSASDGADLPSKSL